MRARPFLSLFAASLIATLPVHALAQELDRTSTSVRDRPRPEYDPLGLRFGGMMLNASLALSATATDNVFATETGAQDDISYAVAPRARLSSDWLRHAVSVEAGARFVNYSDFSSEDAETAYLGANARLDVGRSSFVRLSGRVSEEVEPRTDPDALTFGGPVEYSRNEVALEGEHTFNRVRLRGRVAHIEHDFDDVGAVDQDFRDREQDVASLRVDVEVAPRVAILLQATADEREFSNAPALSSDGATYLAGVAVNFTDLLYGEFSIGQFERNYDFGGDVEGTAMAGSLEWQITQLTTINVNAGRTVEETGATVGQPFVATNYGISVDHEFLRNLIGTAGVSFGQNDYEIIDRDDEYMAGEIGLDYLVNRRVVLFGRYRHDSLESSGANRYRDFDVDTVTAGVRLQL